MITAEEELTVTRRWETAERRPRAAAARLFHDALNQHDRSHLSPKSEANNTLNYFLVIERIAEQLGGRSDEEARPTKETETVLARLREELASSEGLTVQARAVCEARDAIARLEMRFLNQKIERTGECLSLNDSVVSDALGLAKLRSRSLAHPGPGQRPDAIQLTSSDAQRVAREFLVAYLDYVGT